MRVMMAWRDLEARDDDDVIEAARWA